MKKSKRIKKSNSWKIKQHRDQFFKKSKTLGYRSRASFKLIELNKKFKFIKKDTDLLDLAVHNPNIVEKIDERTSEEIISEIKELDNQSSEVLKKIEKLL